MDFLSLSSPILGSILNKTRILATSYGKDEVLEKISRILPSDLRAKIDSETKSYSSSLKSLGASVVGYFDPEYPPLLREIYDPPPNLFYYGNPEVFRKSFLAVVGTRKASPVTLALCKAVPPFSRSIGAEGIVSGLALGVDAEAMNVALNEEFPVIGIMGTGPEKEYPTENRNLYSRMKLSKNALIVTEYPPGFQIRKYAFPKRNRIITGISSALLVMEAPARSGALSSASNAISQNREIYVFNHPYQFQNEGGRRLISEGANETSLTENVSEKIEVFHTDEILPDNFDELPGMLAQIGKQKLNGNWIELQAGFFRSQK